MGHDADLRIALGHESPLEVADQVIEFRRGFRSGGSVFRQHLTRLLMISAAATGHLNSAASIPRPLLPPAPGDRSGRPGRRSDSGRLHDRCDDHDEIGQIEQAADHEPAAGEAPATRHWHEDDRSRREGDGR